MNLARWFVAVTTTLALVPAMWIGSAYATQLSPLRKPVIVSNVILGASTNPGPFLKRLAESVKDNRSTLLWSVYPASVRGQVVLDVTPGSDPMMTGGW
jgi:hypothetical protein